jgi:hypothetical protein
MDDAEDGDEAREPLLDFHGALPFSDVGVSTFLMRHPRHLVERHLDCHPAPGSPYQVRLKFREDEISNRVNRLLRALVLAAGLAIIPARAQLLDTNGPPSDAATQSSSGKQFLPWEKGALRFGAFVTFFNSTLAFGLNNAPGISINAENSLGLATSITVFRADAMYRPGQSRRNQLDFDYASYDRTGEATLTKDLPIGGGNVIPVGAHIQTTFDFDIIRGTYTYAFLQDERMRIAGGLGIYVVPLKYGLDVQTAGGHSSVGGADTTLPLPSLALRAEFQLIPKLFLNGSIDAMYLEISHYRGSLVDLNVGLEYRPWKHIGFGAGYSFTSMSVDSENSSSEYPGANFVGNVDVRFSGLLLYGKYSF